MQPPQGLQIRFGKQVGPTGQHLSEFYKRGTHGFEVIGQLFRVCIARLLQRALFAHFFVHAHLLDEIGATVLP